MVSMLWMWYIPCAGSVSVSDGQHVMDVMHTLCWVSVCIWWSACYGCDTYLVLVQCLYLMVSMLWMWYIPCAGSVSVSDGQHVMDVMHTLCWVSVCIWWSACYGCDTYLVLIQCLYLMVSMLWMWYIPCAGSVSVSDGQHVMDVMHTLCWVSVCIWWSACYGCDTYLVLVQCLYLMVSMLWMWYIPCAGSVSVSDGQHVMDVIHTLCWFSVCIWWSACYGCDTYFVLVQCLYLMVSMLWMWYIPCAGSVSVSDGQHVMEVIHTLCSVSVCIWWSACYGCDTYLVLIQCLYLMVSMLWMWYIPYAGSVSVSDGQHVMDVIHTLCWFSVCIWWSACYGCDTYLVLVQCLYLMVSMLWMWYIPCAGSVSVSDGKHVMEVIHTLCWFSVCICCVSCWFWPCCFSATSSTTSGRVSTLWMAASTSALSRSILLPGQAESIKNHDNAKHKHVYVTSALFTWIQLPLLMSRARPVQTRKFSLDLPHTPANTQHYDAVMVVVSRKIGRKYHTNREPYQPGPVVCKSITLFACPQLLPQMNATKEIKQPPDVIVVLINIK